MNTNLKQSLKAEFPQFFEKVSYGFDCGDGWFELLKRTCQKIKDLNPSPEFRFLQIKEKFGGLRLYVHEANEQIGHILSDAENQSVTICESCGTTEDVTVGGVSWMKTYCKGCRNVLF